MTIRRSESPDTRLPYELWLQIVELVPPADWHYALSVNKILFDFVMDKWYSTINMTDWRQTMDIMTRSKSAVVIIHVMRVLI